MYVSSRTPQPDASESGPGEVKHTAFEHSMAAGFVNAPPRLRSSNLGQPDHKRRNSAAFQVEHAILYQALAALFKAQTHQSLTCVVVTL